MSRPLFPEFYIAGAPKCGTTALYNYLCENPAVFMPSFKEPHYFAPDFGRYRVVSDEKTYCDLFREARPGQMRGEASVWYLYSRVAPALIAEVRPDARIIVMLRNPVEAARSMHAQQIIGLQEDILEFQSAWHAQADRAAGRRVPFFCPDPAMLLYGQVYSYAHQVQRLFEYFPQNQVKVVIYEEMFSEPERFYSEIQSFLGIPLHLPRSFERINPGRLPGNILLHRFITRPPAFLGHIYNGLSWLSRRFGLHLGILAARLMGVRSTARAELPPAFRDELNAYFAPDVARLEKLLGRPLDVWR